MLLAGLVSAALPAAAQAHAASIAPPGNSAVSQYVETIPTATGARPTAPPVTHVAPPGNSAVSQYIETVPTAGGGRPTQTVNPAGGGAAAGGAGGGSSPGSSGSGAIPQATARALTSDGAQGAAAAALAQSMAPSQVQTHISRKAKALRSKRHSKRGSRVLPARHRSVSSRSGTAVSRATSTTRGGGSGASPAQSLADAVTGSTGGGGLGILLPAILAVILAGGGLTSWLRRRPTD